MPVNFKLGFVGVVNQGIDMWRILFFLVLAFFPYLSIASDDIFNAEKKLHEIFPTAKVKSKPSKIIKGNGEHFFAFLVDQEDYKSFPMRIVIIKKNNKGEYVLYGESGSWFYVGRMIEKLKIQNNHLVYIIEGDGGGASWTYSAYKFKISNNKTSLVESTLRSYEYNILQYQCKIDFQKKLKSKTIFIDSNKKRVVTEKISPNIIFSIEKFAAISEDIGAGDGVGGYECD
ncbi:MAG: hypothetical protein U1E99_10665 [Agitococcus sp.]